MVKARGESVDKILLATIILIGILGVVYLYSATWDPQKIVNGLNPLVLRQCVWVSFGFLILLVIANTDYNRILNYAYLAYILNLVALLFILFFCRRKVRSEAMDFNWANSTPTLGICKAYCNFSFSGFSGR